MNNIQGIPKVVLSPAFVEAATRRQAAVGEDGGEGDKTRKFIPTPALPHQRGGVLLVIF